MQGPIIHILPVAAIRRERFMPTGGRIIARRGQQLSPADVVAEVMVHPEHLLLNIGLGLGLPPKEADHYIQHRAGDEVGEGDVIAGPVGIGRRVVRTPKAGKVVVAGDGQVLLELEGEFSELKAGYTGVVSEILGDQGVVIDTMGSLIQGVWGNGKVNYGLLNILGRTPDDLITSEMMDINLRGSVIMACCCEDERVLRSADEMPVRGMILASMDSTLVPIALSVSYPIVLLEGFGKIPMNLDAFGILTSSAMKEVALNAEPRNRITNTRPEVVISLPEGTLPEIPTESAAFAIGQTVRVSSPPYKSQVGTLTNLPSGLYTLPSGLRAQTAEVKLMNGDRVQVPLANLEIIG